MSPRRRGASPRLRIAAGAAGDRDRVDRAELHHSGEADRAAREHRDPVTVPFVRWSSSGSPGLADDGARRLAELLPDVEQAAAHEHAIALAQAPSAAGRPRSPPASIDLSLITSTCGPPAAGVAAARSRGGERASESREEPAHGSHCDGSTLASVASSYTGAPSTISESGMYGMAEVAATGS